MFRYIKLTVILSLIYQQAFNVRLDGILTLGDKSMALTLGCELLQ